MPPGMSEDDFERKLYIARRRAEKVLETLPTSVFDLSTLSRREISYKGRLCWTICREFYPDLSEVCFASSLAVFQIGSPPTPGRSGAWRSCSAISRITARSTRRRAT